MTDQVQCWWSSPVLLPHPHPLLYCHETAAGGTDCSNVSWSFTHVWVCMNRTGQTCKCVCLIYPKVFQSCLSFCTPVSLSVCKTLSSNEWLSVRPWYLPVQMCVCVRRGVPVCNRDVCVMQLMYVCVSGSECNTNALLTAYFAVYTVSLLE